jgi:hypothetical protein
MSLTINSPLSRFSRQVASTRTAFFRGLRTLPPELARNAADHYRGRLQRGLGKPLLGEYAPWLLADLLPLGRRGVVRQIAPAWMQLYASTLFMDDVLDRPSGAATHPTTLLASALLLERGVSDILRLLPQGTNVRVRLDRYFVAAARATLTEIQRHRARLEDYSEEDVARLGEKVSLLKLCASCLLAADGNTAVREEVLVPVESLATGAQLLDDATDWEEDWRGGNYTFLLSRTFKRLREGGLLRGQEPASFTASELLVGMILTGSLEECVSRGLKCLRKVVLSPHLRRGSTADKLLQAMIQENATFLQEVTDARQSLERTRRDLPRRGRDWLSRLVRQPQARRQISWVKRRMLIVAQNT